MEELSKQSIGRYNQRSKNIGSAAVVGSTLRMSKAYKDGFELFSELQSENPTIEIRQEQAECLDAIQVARENGQKRALVQMATGLGKTLVVAGDVRRVFATNPDSRVLFLCHQNDILQQAKSSFEEVVGMAHSYGIFTGESKDYHEVSCLFASFQAMREWREAFIPNEFDYIVVDESHHAKAATYEPTLNYFQPEFMLGVTATPDRHDLRDIREIFGKEVYKLSLEEAIARGLLANVGYSVIADDVVNTQILKDAYGRRHNLKQLDRTIFAPKRDEEIVRIIDEKSQDIPDVKRIIFCKSIEQANQYAIYFAGSEALHSKISKAQQDQSINKFRLGAINTLITVDMFNEGIDIPDANQIVFLRSTQSKTVFLQQLGRGLRKQPGKDSVQILDFVANCDRLLMLRDVWNTVESYQRDHSVNKLKDKRVYISVGNVVFDDESRNVLDILTEMENINALYAAWSPQDSIDLYLKFNDELGHVPTQEEMLNLWREGRAPGWTVLTRAFNHSLVELREACGLGLPEGWATPRQIAIKVDVAKETVHKAMVDLGITPTMFTLRTQKRPGLSPEDQARLYNHQKLKVVEQAPEGYVPISKIEQELSLNRQTIIKIAGKLAIEQTLYRGERNVPTLHYSRDQIAQIIRMRPAVPEDYISVLEIAEASSKNSLTVVNVCREMGITIEYYFDVDNIRKMYISSSDFTRLSEDIRLNVTSKPIGYTSLSDLVVQLEIPRRSLNIHLNRLGITTTRFAIPEKSRKSYDECIKDADIAKLIDLPEVSAPFKPDGYYSKSALQGILHTSSNRIDQAIKALQLQPTLYKKPLSSGLANYYSPAQISEIIEYLNS